MSARIFLAFLATAGIFYVNIMPAIVDGLINALNFSNQQAGYVASANLYGAAFGALLIVFLVKKLNWRLAATVFLLAIMGLDLASLLVSRPEVMIPLRFLHGFIGGMLVGTAFSIIARTDQPDRTFGVLLFVQFGLGGLGVMLIPGLVPEYGTSVLFLSLLAFSAVSLVMLGFLPAFEVDEQRSAARPLFAMTLPAFLTLIGIFLFQAANMGLYAYIIGLGLHFGLEMDFITRTLGAAAWIGLAGAGAVILVSDRLGYFRPLVIAITLTAAGSWAFLYSDIHWVWICANLLIGITWAFTMSYLLGLMSRFDAHGQMAALGGFASKMGLASGPAVCALLLGEDNYALIIWVAVIALIACVFVVARPALIQDKG